MEEHAPGGADGTRQSSGERKESESIEVASEALEMMKTCDSNGRGRHNSRLHAAKCALSRHARAGAVGNSEQRTDDSIGPRRASSSSTRTRDGKNMDLNAGRDCSQRCWKRGKAARRGAGAYNNRVSDGL